MTIGVANLISYLYFIIFTNNNKIKGNDIINIINDIVEIEKKRSITLLMILIIKDIQIYHLIL